MKRLKKAILMPVRTISYRWKLLRLYYWADEKLYKLNMVDVMPYSYYHWLYKLSMKLVDFNRTRRLADWAIHTIPYHIRFKVA